MSDVPGSDNEREPAPDYDQLADMFWLLGSMLNPSQLQGFLLGQLAAGAELTPTQWFEQAALLIDPVEPMDETARSTLVALFQGAQNLLEEADMEQQLTLPSDSLDLAQQAACISDWSKGFLAGFAEAGKARQKSEGQQQYSPVVSEALSDVAAIAQIELEEESDAEEVAQDLFQLQEYLRLVALNVFVECRGEPEAEASEQKGEKSKTENSPADLFNKTLH